MMAKLNVRVKSDYGDEVIIPVSLESTWHAKEEFKQRANALIDKLQKIIRGDIDIRNCH